MSNKWDSAARGLDIEHSIASMIPTGESIGGDGLLEFSVYLLKIKRYAVFILVYWLG